MERTTHIVSKSNFIQSVLLNLNDVFYKKWINLYWEDTRERKRQFAAWIEFEINILTWLSEIFDNFLQHFILKYI